MKTTISTQMITGFSERQVSQEWNKLTFAQQLEIKFNHEMQVKFQKNREIYADKFGVYFEDDIITDEEIAETEALELEIRKAVEADMAKYYVATPTSKKVSKTKAEGNLNFLF